MKKLLLAFLLFVVPAFGQFASDTFTDTDGVHLQNHTPNIGGSWTLSRGSTNLDINTNHIYATASAGIAYYTISASPASADADVQADFYCVGGQTMPLIVGRASTSATTAYGVRVNSGTTWNLYRWLAGAISTIGTYSGDSCTTTRTVKLQMRGTAIKVYIGGVERISVTNSDVTAAGKAGVGTYYSYVGTSYWLDNFSATDAPPASTARKQRAVTF